MKDKSKFAFEKFFALVTSQRTVTTLVGLALIVFLFQNGMATLTGGEAWEFDEEAVAAAVGELLAVAGMVITAIIGVLQLTKNNANSVHEKPPSLNRQDYEGSRVGSVKTKQITFSGGSAPSQSELARAVRDEIATNL